MFADCDCHVRLQYKVYWLLQSVLQILEASWSDNVLRNWMPPEGKQRRLISKAAISSAYAASNQQPYER